VVSFFLQGDSRLEQEYFLHICTGIKGIDDDLRITNIDCCVDNTLSANKIKMLLKTGLFWFVFLTIIKLFDCNLVVITRR